MRVLVLALALVGGARLALRQRLPGRGRSAGRFCDPYSLGPDAVRRGAASRRRRSGPTTGRPCVAPAAGVVSFAGTVPTHGRTVTIQTADGHAVSLTHLGRVAVARGDSVAEGDSDRRRRHERRAGVAVVRTCTSGSGSARAPTATSTR